MNLKLGRFPFKPKQKICHNLSGYKTSQHFTMKKPTETIVYFINYYSFCQIALNLSFGSEKRLMMRKKNLLFCFLTICQWSLFNLESSYREIGFYFKFIVCTKDFQIDREAEDFITKSSIKNMLECFARLKSCKKKFKLLIWCLDVFLKSFDSFFNNLKFIVGTMHLIRNESHRFSNEWVVLSSRSFVLVSRNHNFRGNSL